MKITHNNRDNQHYIWLGAILIIGSGLRLTRLGWQSEWNDEALSVAVSSGTINQIVTNAFQSRHPPGYYLLLHFWQAILGDSDFALRLFSALPGIAALVTMYVLGRIMFSQKTGLVAAAFTAIMPFHLYYAQEIRSYSWLFFLSTIILLCRVQIERDKRAVWWVIYGAAAVLGNYMHYLFTLIIGVTALHFLCHLWYTERNLWHRPFWLSHLLIGAASLPLIPMMLKEASGPDYWIESVSIGEFFAMPLSFTMSQFLPFGLLMVAYGLLLMLVIMTLLQFIRAGIQRDQLSEFPWVVFIFEVYWLPVLLLFVVAVVWTPLTNPRLMIIAVPGLYLLLAWGATMTRERWFIAALLAGVSLLGVIGCYNWLFNPLYQKPPAREAALWLEEQSEPDETILFAGDSGFRLFNRYTPDLAHTLVLDDDNPYRNITVIPEVIQLMGGEIVAPEQPMTGTFWLVLHLDFDIELQEDIWQQYERKYERIAVQDIGGILLYRYQALIEPEQ